MSFVTNFKNISTEKQKKKKQLIASRSLCKRMYGGENDFSVFIFCG